MYNLKIPSTRRTSILETIIGDIKGEGFHTEPIWQVHSAQLYGMLRI